jgi:uncharacterized membrane protein YhaH (DUF805 family)
MPADPAATSPSPQLSYLLYLLLPYFVCMLLFVAPFALVFRRIGRSPWWALIGLIPLAMFVLPWIAALIRWKDGPSRGL